MCPQFELTHQSLTNADDDLVFTEKVVLCEVGEERDGEYRLKFKLCKSNSAFKRAPVGMFESVLPGI